VKTSLFASIVVREWQARKTSPATQPVLDVMQF
jgi:hypothetical protein